MNPQYAGHVVSLGCRPGKVIVRAVHKALVAQDGCGNSHRLVWHVTGTTGANSVLHGATDVQRCELQLSPHTDGEVTAALRSTEVNCKPCTSCDGCPEAVEGRWYSETFYATLDGCDAVAKLEGEPYVPFMPSIAMNAGAMFLHAKFEVQEVK
ncbi:hypothetical protein FOA52_013802 [Chlamydomonas sp. UWO 241]|nr:hypothetical protein FOA52_013802 [Chlamydomonas sp. UWO 241]